MSQPATEKPAQTTAPASQSAVPVREEKKVEPTAAPASPKPVERKATPEEAPTGILPGSISIKMKPVAVPVRPSVKENTLPLTEERLQEAWTALLEEWKSTKPEMYSVLNGHAVTLAENNTFTIEATNSNFERDLRPIQTSMLEYLRAHLSCATLQCRVVVRVEQRESKVYQPNEKYETMLQTNPELAKMRMVFSDLDY